LVTSTPDPSAVEVLMLWADLVAVPLVSDSAPAPATMLAAVLVPPPGGAAGALPVAVVAVDAAVVAAAVDAEPVADDAELVVVLEPHAARPTAAVIVRPAARVLRRFIMVVLLALGPTGRREGGHSTGGLAISTLPPDAWTSLGPSLALDPVPRFTPSRRDA
jgi:hypothetical protein